MVECEGNQRMTSISPLPVIVLSEDIKGGSLGQYTSISGD